MSYMRTRNTYLLLDAMHGPEKRLALPLEALAVKTERLCRVSGQQ